MKLPFDIARRYLFAKKSQNVINVISMISVVGVMVGTIALLIVLSVFNGLHGLIGTLYGTFDPDLRIDPAIGKVFSLDTIPYQQLIQFDEIECVSQVVSDQALLKYDRRTVPAMIVGVDTLFNKVTGIDSIMTDGQFQMDQSHANVAYLGFILADQLSVGLNFVSSLVVYVPRRSSGFNSLDPTSAFNREVVMPVGIFAVKQVEYDSQYLIVHINKARKLLEYPSKTVSNLYVKVKPNADVDKLKSKIQQVVGKGLLVKTQEEQHETFFKMMKVEKLMAYLILSFILVIAAFNVVGTISMLIYEKKESIFTLRSMGANQKMVTMVFLFEGWLISLAGVIAGLTIGTILIVIQQQFGLIKFQGGSSFVVDAYPVIITMSDFLLVFATVIVVSFLAAWYPVKTIVSKHYSSIAE